VLDDGRLTDGAGRTVDFRHTVIIMTSNIGSEAILEEEDPGRRAGYIERALRTHFRPEFLNRIEEVVVFNRLSPQDLEAIARLAVADVARRLERQHVRLEVDRNAVAWLAARGYDPEFGARPLTRVVRRELEDALALMLLTGELEPGGRLVVTVEGDALRLVASQRAEADTERTDEEEVQPARSQDGAKGVDPASVAG